MSCATTSGRGISGRGAPSLLDRRGAHRPRRALRSQDAPLPQPAGQPEEAQGREGLARLRQAPHVGPRGARRSGRPCAEPARDSGRHPRARGPRLRHLDRPCLLPAAHGRRHHSGRSVSEQGRGTASRHRPAPLRAGRARRHATAADRRAGSVAQPLRPSRPEGDPRLAAQGPHRRRDHARPRRLFPQPRL